MKIMDWIASDTTNMLISAIVLGITGGMLLVSAFLWLTPPFVWIPGIALFNVAIYLGVTALVLLLINDKGEDK